jgi:prevent-host-death family protein
MRHSEADRPVGDTGLMQPTATSARTSTRRPFSGTDNPVGVPNSMLSVGAMDLSNDVQPVTALKRSAAELIARATDRHSPIVITRNGRPTAVLQDVHSYRRQQRVLHLLKLIAQGEQDYRAGRTHDQASVDELVGARLAERRGAP